PRGIDARLHVGQLERDRLEVGDLAPELFSLLRVLQRVLIRCAGNPERHRADGGPRPFKGLHRRLACGTLTFAAAGDSFVEPLLAADDQTTGNSDILEYHLGGMRRPNTVLLELLSLFEPRRVRRNDERGLPTAAEFRMDRRNNYVHVGNSPVGGPGLEPVEPPLVGGIVVTCAGEDGAHIGARTGFR